MRNTPLAPERIRYTTADKNEHVATIVGMPFTLPELPPSELTTLQHLASAASAITPVFALQADERSLRVFRELLVYEQSSSRYLAALERRALREYLTLYAARQGPFDQRQQGALFPFPLPSALKQHENMLNGEGAFNSGSLYPADITEEEFASLGDGGNIINSVVTRNGDGSLDVVINEHFFKKQLAPAIDSLRKAAQSTRNNELRVYIQARIEELQCGSALSRKMTDHAWLENEGPIDFSVSTAVETYADQFKQMRGMAESFVGVKDPRYDALATQFVSLLPEFDRRAPWLHKAKRFPHTSVRYVNLLAGSGALIGFPAIARAWCLPNDEVWREEHGTIITVSVNIEQALMEHGSDRITYDAFIPAEERASYGRHFAHMNLLLHSLHELGHVAGGFVTPQPPSKVFGNEFHTFDEAKAELFSLWALPVLKDKGVITADQEIAGYYTMVQSMGNALRFPPRDHSGARNVMLHYFLEDQGLVEVQEEGEGKFLVADRIKLRSSVTSLLSIIADGLATGDTSGLAALAEQYTRTDRKDEIARRLSSGSRGVGLVFPILVQGKDGAQIAHPDSFMNQPRSLNHFL